MDEHSPFTKGLMNILQAFKEVVKSFKGCETYADKIERWNNLKYLNSWLEVAEPMRCGFQVLNHGDLWSNNVMFTVDDAKNPTNVQLIDFQTPFWASPSHDLLFFLLTSVAGDIKVDHFDDLIEFYSVKLTKDLKNLKYDQHIPTLSELHIDLLDKGSFSDLE